MGILFYLFLLFCFLHFGASFAQDPQPPSTQCEDVNTQEKCKTVGSTSNCAWCDSTEKCVSWNRCNKRPVKKQNCDDSWVIYKGGSTCSFITFWKWAIIVILSIFGVIIAMIMLCLMVYKLINCVKQKDSYTQLWQMNDGFCFLFIFLVSMEILLRDHAYVASSIIGAYLICRIIGNCRSNNNKVPYNPLDNTYLKS